MTQIDNIKRMITIPDFLRHCGFSPVNRKGDYLHYHSPLRKDENPSFWVDEKKGICGDFADGGCIGDVINLAARWYHCNIKDAIANLADIFRLGGFSFDKPMTFAKETHHKSAATESRIFIRHIQELQNAALLQYIGQRGISTDTARKYLQEVYYTTYPTSTARPYFALGFRNDLGGYELRSKFFKGSTSSKTVTTIKQGSDTVLVFEGFTSFLSCVEYWNSLNKTIPYDVIVLNSLANISKANFAGYATIKLMLDADEPGHTATDRLMAQYPNVINITPKFIPYDQATKTYNDFNDYWLKHINGTR